MSNNIVICLNENNIKILEEIKSINCYILDCSSNWKINQKKRVNKEDLCFDNSNRNIFFKYEYQGLFYEDCKNGNLTNNNIINYCKCNTKCSDCIYYYYFDNFNNYYCTKNKSCPAEYPILNEIECKKNNIKDMIENVINNTQIKKEEEINYYNAILKSIEDIYTSKNFYTHNIDNGNDEIIEMEKVKVILTTSENQKKNLDGNMTSIDLGGCEHSLRQSYNLPNDSVLYIKMLEIFQEGMRIPKIEYNLYSKSEEGNFTKLSLNSCKNNKISLLIPVDNISNIDKLNIKSGYYNDFCYTATSDSGTDITLKDRKNEYPSKTVCQDDCNFVGYNYTTKKAKCSCKAKESSLNFADMKIDKKSY